MLIYLNSEKILESQTFLKKSIIYTPKTTRKEKNSILQVYIIPYHSRWFKWIQSTTSIQWLYCTNNAIQFITYPSYMLWFFNNNLPKKQNLETDLLQAYKGGLNSKENWLHSCISLINKGSQFCIKLLPKVNRLAPKAQEI